VVYVDEQVCIGCTLCIQACPVDAFVGASKVMTTVIEDECTGCDLCITSHDLSPLNLEHSCPKLSPNPCKRVWML
jgi:electron transport complex protein RnfB